MTNSTTLNQFSKLPTQQFEIYKNKKSKLNESILIHQIPEKGLFTFHIYAILLPSQKQFTLNEEIIDLRKNKYTELKSPLKNVSNVSKGSLSIIRYFLKNPDEEKYIQKMKEKYPDKKKFVNKKYFPPLILIIAHYCDQYSQQISIKKEVLSNTLLDYCLLFDDFVQENLHQILKTFGKPLYLKGETNLINFYQTREFPESFLKKFFQEKLLLPVTKQISSSILIHPIKGLRKDVADQIPLIQESINPKAISHVLNNKNKFLPLHLKNFPIVVIGNPETRRNLILNILKNANARYLIFDPNEYFGQLTHINPRIRGYLLGTNYFLNIASTEGKEIREQVYAYWFARIIANISGLRNELTKTIETYLLGVYRDPNNQSKGFFNFKDFANQDLTSEVTKMGRSESATIANVLYPLGTYDEISLFTKIGRSLSFETIFETKGTILQFDKNDDQLTKIAYLFTILKLRSIINDDPKIIVLENLDDIIDQTSKTYQDNTLTDLILSLSANYNIIIGARSPSKINGLFKGTHTKFINQLLMMSDFYLLKNEYQLSNQDSTNLTKLTEKEFLVLLPEYATPNYIKIDSELDTKMQVKIDDIERESGKKLITSKEFLQNKVIAPELQKVIFELIKVLREKSKKVIPEEGFEKLLINCDEIDILRAKEIAKNESFIKIVESSPQDSNEIINLIKLTERGEEYYLSYLHLQKQIPFISINSLPLGKKFEQDIFETLGQINKLFEINDNINIIEKMLTITLMLLAVLPEEDRFKNDKPASKLLEYWSYLMSMKELNNFSYLKGVFQEFLLLATNTLKSIKNKMFEEKLEPNNDNEVKKEQNIEQSSNNEESLVEQNSSEYEIAINPKEKRELTIIKENEEKIKPDVEDSTNLEEKAGNNLFLAASDDLKNAGLPHLDFKGQLYSPNKGNIFDDNLYEKADNFSQLDNDPFSSNIESENKNLKSSIQLQKETLDSLKKKLIQVIARNLKVKKIDDDFIWSCLTSRYNGKINEEYKISEVVYTLKELYFDLENGLVILDSIVQKIDNLIDHSMLLPDELIADLKQYLNNR